MCQYVIIWQYVIIASPQYLIICIIMCIVSLTKETNMLLYYFLGFTVIMKVIKLVILILFDQISDFFNIMAAILDLCKLGIVPRTWIF